MGVGELYENSKKKVNDISNLSGSTINKEVGTPKKEDNTLKKDTLKKESNVTLEEKVDALKKEVGD